MQAETQAQIAKIQAQAEMQIASAAKSAILELKAYSAQLALELAEKQIRERLDPQTQDRSGQRLRERPAPRKVGASGEACSSMPQRFRIRYAQALADAVMSSCNRDWIRNRRWPNYDVQRHGARVAGVRHVLLSPAVSNTKKRAVVAPVRRNPFRSHGWFGISYTSSSTAAASES